MVFWHLSLKEWRHNAKDYCQRQIGIFGWLEERNLPPIPQDKYCYETRQWVDDMNRDDKAAYLKELRAAKGLNF
jgi:hypothetical protein